MRSRELAHGPRAVKLWGRRFVLFRDGEGRAAAFADRCPHRNVPLSLGRVNAQGQLECPYHGWCFDGQGQCVSVPGRVEAGKAPSAWRFELREDADFLWLCPSPEGPLLEPFALPLRHEKGYVTLIREVKAGASLYAVLENALDVPHTSILHRGLFRGGARSRVRVVVRRQGGRIEAEYSGEPPPRGLLARVLSASGGGEQLDVSHWDRFMLPSVLQVEYRLGRAVHLCVTGLGVPIDDDETRLYAVISLRTPGPTRLLAGLLEPFGRWIFSQDRRILERQTENVLAFGGESFASTELDALGPPIWRLIRQQAELERGNAPEAEARPGGEGERTGSASSGDRGEILADFELDA
ncbi:MAG TPA: aromatic ring-hydroxylating dioxygenase subunit alpha [Polyangiaceae bacterium]|nr:aromatic ring-hydroxylating dioxygenase subunit alpha [Polyangiaceae bacterium]